MTHEMIGVIGLIVLLALMFLKIPLGVSFTLTWTTSPVLSRSPGLFTFSGLKLGVDLI